MILLGYFAGYQIFCMWAWCGHMHLVLHELSLNLMCRDLSGVVWAAHSMSGHGGKCAQNAPRQIVTASSAIRKMCMSLFGFVDGAAMMITAGISVHDM